MSDGGENKRGRDLQDVIVPCRGVGTVSWAVFSSAELGAAKSAQYKILHCSISFVFVNFCPNID
jgi:hypothetical protein